MGTLNTPLKNFMKAMSESLAPSSSQELKMGIKKNKKFKSET